MGGVSNVITPSCVTLNYKRISASQLPPPPVSIVIPPKPVGIDQKQIKLVSQGAPKLIRPGPKPVGQDLRLVPTSSSVAKPIILPAGTKQAKLVSPVSTQKPKVANQVRLVSPSQVGGGSGNYVQYYQVPAQSLPPSLVPVQLVSSQSTSLGGGLVLLQPSGVSKEVPQRVSVIMNPRQIIQTLPGTLGPPQGGNITQLDGPVGRGRGKKRKREDLDKEFEKTRKDLTQPMTTATPTSSTTHEESPHSVATCDVVAGPSSNASDVRKRKRATVDKNEDGKGTKNKGKTKKRKIENEESNGGGEEEEEEGESASPAANGKSFSCPKCSTIMPSKPKLQTHIETTHLSISVR